MGQTKKILVLSLDEAKRHLAEFYVETIGKDVDALLDGTRPPDFKRLTSSDVTDMLYELELADKLAQEHNVDYVMVELEPYQSGCKRFDCIGESGYIHRAL